MLQCLRFQPFILRRIINNNNLLNSTCANKILKEINQISLNIENKTPNKRASKEDSNSSDDSDDSSGSDDSDQPHSNDKLLSSASKKRKQNSENKKTNDCQKKANSRLKLKKTIVKKVIFF